MIHMKIDDVIYWIIDDETPTHQNTIETAHGDKCFIYRTFAHYHKTHKCKCKNKFMCVQTKQREKL